MTISRARPAHAATPGRRRTGIRLALIGASIAALAAALITTGSASADNTAGPVVGYGGLCLDAQGASAAEFTPVQVYTCNGTDAQQWALDGTTTQALGTSIEALGMCLDVQGGGTADGTPVDLHDCNGTGAQVWVPVEGGHWLNPQSNKCLDDTNWSTTPGTQAQIWDCTGNENQTWSVPWQWTVMPGVPIPPSDD
jgi:hypothetical protein